MTNPTVIASICVLVRGSHVSNIAHERCQISLPGGQGRLPAAR